jgi:ribonuclease G
MRKRILVDADRRESRVAVLEDGVLVELYIEREGEEGITGNIYKGRVVNVLPGMEAAFVDIGVGKNAFLYAGDILEPEDYDEMFGEDLEGPARRSRASISDVLRRGQELLVQVVREPVGTKGPRVTTYITIPGRNLVLMPLSERIGVSRRISREEEKSRLRDIAREIKPPGVGLIIRTAAEGATKEEIEAEFNALMDLWRKIYRKKERASAPALIHKEVSLLERIGRDFITEDVDEVLVGGRDAYERIIGVFDSFSYPGRSKVKLYEGEKPLFERYGVEKEILKATSRVVSLKSGGYIAIDRTEALTVVDVNSGKYIGGRGQRDTILRINMEAAVEIARQLRLRDIGGIIIIDFIDMEVEEDKERVIQVFEEELKKDRARTYISHISQLGLVEMTRKRGKQSLDEQLKEPCPYCKGEGRVLSSLTVAIKIQRELERSAIIRGKEVVVEVHPSIVPILSSGKAIEEIERVKGCRIKISPNKDLHVESYSISW